jgi:hypothetical protein
MREGYVEEFLLQILDCLDVLQRPVVPDGHAHGRLKFGFVPNERLLPLTLTTSNPLI